MRSTDTGSNLAGSMTRATIQMIEAIRGVLVSAADFTSPNLARDLWSRSSWSWLVCFVAGDNT